MLVTCPQCNKKLKVPESAAGKKVRCPGCQKVVVVPDLLVEVAAPPPLPEIAPGGSTQSIPPPLDVTPPAKSTMRCAVCNAASVQRLPPNQFSRHPGYICSSCGAVMRRPGTTVSYAFFTILRGVMCLLSILLLCYLAFADLPYRGRLMGGAGGMAGLCAVVTGWTFKQLRLPVPLDVPARPSRLWIFLVVFLIGLLILGGGAFLFMYFLHEM